MTNDFICSQFDRLRGYHLFKRTQSLQRLLAQWRVYLDHRHCFTTSLAAPEMETTNIYVAVAQGCSDTANHTGNIVIASHEHVAFRFRLEIKTVDFRYTP